MVSALLNNTPATLPKFALAASTVISVSPMQLAKAPLPTLITLAGLAIIQQAQSRTFVNGVLTIADVQEPDPTLLPQYDDRSRFAGPGTAFGTKLTFRIEANLSGPAMLAEGMVVKSFEQMADKTLANVKAMAEV